MHDWSGLDGPYAYIISTYFFWMVHYWRTPNLETKSPSWVHSQGNKIWQFMSPIEKKMRKLRVLPKVSKIVPENVSYKAVKKWRSISKSGTSKPYNFKMNASITHDATKFRKAEYLAEIRVSNLFWPKPKLGSVTAEIIWIFAPLFCRCCAVSQLRSEKTEKLQVVSWTKTTVAFCENCSK